MGCPHPPGLLLFGTEIRGAAGLTGSIWASCGVLTGTGHSQCCQCLQDVGVRVRVRWVGGGIATERGFVGTHARHRRSAGHCRVPALPTHCSQRSVLPHGRRNPSRSLLPHRKRLLSSSGGSSPRPHPPPALAMSQPVSEDTAQNSACISWATLSASFSIWLYCAGVCQGSKGGQWGRPHGTGRAHGRGTHSRSGPSWSPPGRG